MSLSTRTAKSFKNSFVALFFSICELLLRFYSRKVFFDYLGAEVLGLNTTAQSILSFLNLAELGIGSAVAFSLYKPIYDKDEGVINEIISLQGWFYQRVALIVISGSLLVMFFFPMIFSKADIPLWYAFASYSVLLFSSLLSYFINYREILLSADQKDYLIQLNYRLPMIIKVVFQIVLIQTLANGFLIWIVLEFIFAIFSAYLLNRTITRNYPYLKTNKVNGPFLAKKYPIIIKKIKQIFIHKIAVFTLSQTSPVIIYAYASLTLVSLYGNYLAITSGLFVLMNALFNSIGAGVGNLVAENDVNKCLKVFRELFTIRFLVVSLCSYAMYILATPFICNWLGEKYVLDNSVLVITVLTFYLNTSRNTVDSFLQAYGLFNDIWAPVTECILNISLSIALGYYFGLSGILSGVLISSILIVFFWKPYFLFKRGFGRPIKFYIAIYFKHLTILGIVILFMHYLVAWLPVNPVEGFFAFILYALIMCSAFIVLLFSFLYMAETGMRDFVSRCLSFVK